MDGKRCLRSWRSICHKTLKVLFAGSKILYANLELRSETMIATETFRVFKETLYVYHDR